MPYIEGWGFYAKWTGLRVSDLLDAAGVTNGSDYFVLLLLRRLLDRITYKLSRSNHSLIAYGLNDVTLPADRGFPLQLVAESKYGYK